MIGRAVAVAVTVTVVRFGRQSSIHFTRATYLPRRSLPSSLPLPSSLHSTLALRPRFATFVLLLIISRFSDPEVNDRGRTGVLCCTISSFQLTEFLGFVEDFQGPRIGRAGRATFRNAFVHSSARGQ